jgi:hypothetical protein
MNRLSGIGRVCISVFRLALLIVFGVGAGFFLQVAPDLVRFLPDKVLVYSTLSRSVAVAILFLCLPVLLRAWPSSAVRDKVIEPVSRWADTLAKWVLARGLAPGLVVIGVLRLAIWLPHYVSTPWSRDSDTFATLALSWRAGVVPYRDIVAYNFPGHIYLFWLVGTVAGWGQTWGLYLLDAAMLFLFGCALTAWSLRLFETMLPGIVSALVLLLYYSSINFQLFAQRDWHAALAMIFAVMVAEARPSRRGHVVSALAAAAAFSIRPHVVAFLPAIVHALSEPRRDAAWAEDSAADVSATTFGRRAIEWLALFVLFDLLAFAPLAIAGALPGFFQGLSRIVTSGAYGRVTASSALAVLSEAFDSSHNTVIVAWLAFIAVRGPARVRAAAITWLLAIAGAVVYRVPHPVQHLYLGLPLIVTRITALAVIVASVIEARRIPPLAKLASFWALGVFLLLGTNQEIRLKPTIAALQTLCEGKQIPDEPPPGGWPWFYADHFPRYDWASYRDTLIYLREHTGPDTVVANVFRSPPFPSINGAVGRLSPFRVESGICWMWLVHEDRDAEFAAELENSSCEVVVWAPGRERDQGKLTLPRVCQVILSSFEPEVKFGNIEIRRRVRRPGGGTKTNFHSD